jgi:DNA-directed RNA polymerase specialized sigma24 family protein
MYTSWLFRIATHVAWNWLRDRRHESNQLSLSTGLERDSEQQIPDKTADRRSDYDLRGEIGRDPASDRRLAGPSARGRHHAQV